MLSDCEAYGHDVSLVKESRSAEGPQMILWHESTARGLLKQDINEGKHIQLAPLDLYSTRDEYKAFSLKMFRGSARVLFVDPASLHDHQSCCRRAKYAELGRGLHCRPQLFSDHLPHPRILLF